jgi:hypothetical protein
VNIIKEQYECAWLEAKKKGTTQFIEL